MNDHHRSTETIFSEGGILKTMLFVAGAQFFFYCLPQYAFTFAMNENNLLSLTGGVLFHDFVEFIQLVLQYIPILHPCRCFEQFAGMKIDFDYIRFFLCRSLSGRRGCSPCLLYTSDAADEL